MMSYSITRFLTVPALFLRTKGMRGVLQEKDISYMMSLEAILTQIKVGGVFTALK
jgi:hypothetical protein